ncbi:hypothetical protein Bca52824_009199 [Brassica carinata]|uniref:PRA1 family protein n=1 Tax=Brassica carinata TaxID=52824 RepID=A0A8X7WBB6_BRACI|nr:hypothetical protein Bca52824_009199 [Brassica carinata]
MEILQLWLLRHHQSSQSPPLKNYSYFKVNYLAVATAIVGFSLSSSSVSSRLVFVVFLTDVGSVLVSAVMVGVALVCAHGVFLEGSGRFVLG